MKKITTLLSVLMISAVGFQSQAQINTFPYVEDFESGAGGWTAAGGGSFALGTPANTIIDAASSGTNAWVTNLTGDYSANEDSQVESPIFDLSATVNPEIHVKIWWETEFSWDGMVLQSSIDAGTSWQNVGAMGDPNNWYTDNSINANPGGQQDGWTGRNGTGANGGSNGWVTASHPITNLNTQASVTFRFAFSADGSGQDEGVAFDDFSIFDITCPQPLALGDSNVTTTTADLFWSETGSATEWEIEFDTAGFTPTGIATNVGIIDTNFAATALLPNTPYQYFVRAVCGAGDSSLWSGPHSFTTPCTALSVPFAEDFSSTSATQNCWTVLNENTDADAWDMDYAFNPLVGDQVATLNTDGNGGNDDDYLISPTLTLTGNEELRFAYRGQSTFEPNNFQVLISTTGLGVNNFTDTLLVDTATLTTYVKDTIDLSAYTGDVNIAFHVPNGGLDGWRLYIDDVRVTEPCAMPTSGVISALTSTSVSIGWTTSGTAASTWSIEYGPTGFVQGTGSVINGTTFNPHPLAGLSDGTDYDFYIISNCALGDKSPWAGPFNFTTYITGVDENSANNGVSIFPNPNNGIFTLNVNANDATVNVMNTQGQLILTKNILTKNAKIDLSDNAKGIYFVTVTSENGVSTHKVSVQ